MKKTKNYLMTAILAMVLMASITGCADEKTINGVTYRPYGVLNESSHHNPDIHYEVSGQALFSGIAFCEFLFIPTIYTVGYNLWEPECTMAEFNQTTKRGVVK